jgi:hypothetical protein
MPKPLRIFFGCLGIVGLLLVSFVLMILVICFVQNWRGPHVWAATKAKWEARGISLDPHSYFPPPVPDDQNLAALPIFDLSTDPEPYAEGMLAPMQLRQALNEDLHGGELPRLNESEDKIRAGVASAYATVFKGATLPASTLAQFDALYPVIGELRAAAATRPDCQFKQDYTIEPPFARPLALLTEPIAIAKKFAFHAKLALMENKGDISLDDVEMNLRFAEGVERDPTLVAGLVAIGVVAIDRGVIQEGLTSHAWSDAQLAELQSQLAKMDFLSGYEFTMTGETVTGSMAMLDYTKELHRKGGKLSGEKVLDDGMGFGYWPDGWLDLNKSQIVDFEFRVLAGVDPKKRRVHPEVLRDLDVELERVEAIPRRFVPWNILFAVTMRPLTNAQMKFAEAQVWNDQMLIACALERYRLAHGAYPPTLDALPPACIDAVPHDVMNGEPYHYRLNADGTFLLYSVGWNQVDDGGNVAWDPDNPKIQDYKQGDWVWPMVKK